MIPAVAHFIWYGRAFPWVHWLAIHSALRYGGLERAILHHDSDLSHSEHFRRLSSEPGFEARPIGPAPAWFAALGELGDRLGALHDSLRAPSARANVARAALLAQHGGVYLDLDTVTVRSLRPLLDTGVFCGEEHIAFPAHVARSHDPRVLARTLPLVAARIACRSLPDGWRLFRRVEGSYHRAVNNAVLGSAPGHRFIVGLLERMLSLPERAAHVRYALGTHMLQARVAEYEGDDLSVLPPRVFYPLAPEISRHWFRPCRNARPDLVLSADTRVIHWYASVRNRAIVTQMDGDYVERHRDDQLFSALVARLTRNELRTA